MAEKKAKTETKAKPKAKAKAKPKAEAKPKTAVVEVEPVQPALVSGYDAEKLSEFSGMLERQKNIIQGFDVQKAELDGLQGESEADANDDASNLVEMNTLMTLSDSQKSEMRQIETAINKIHGGSYGMCESCGDLIPEPRLKALPFTALCVECKTKEEQGRVVIQDESRLSSDDDIIFRTDDDG
jgi:RNA polymerase-binding transcription factor